MYPNRRYRFRRAVESIIGISSALPTDVLDDEDGREAYKMIGRLLKHVGPKMTSQPLTELAYCSFKSG